MNNYIPDLPDFEVGEDFNYQDFVNSQLLLNDFIEGGEITRSAAVRFAGENIFGYRSVLGLSTSHIFVQHHEKISPKAYFWRGADLIGCKRLSVRMGEGSQKSDSTRGKITEFSYKSRRRLLNTVAKIKRTEMPIFITLTYPNKWDKDPKRWKKDLKNFLERMARAYNKPEFKRFISVLWRLEPQKRGAPHFHLLVWGLPTEFALGKTAFKEWCSENWFEVVNSGDYKHLLAGTKVEKVRSRDGVYFYAAKYLSKTDLEPWEGLEVGRFWGVYFRENMPFGEYVEVTLEDDEALQLLRIMRKKINLIGYAGRSLSIYSNADFWYSKLDKLVYSGPGLGGVA